MDGLFDDWKGDEILLDDSGDARDAELDIGTLHMRSDDQFIHLLIGLNRELNVQRLDGTLELLVNGDGNSDTGIQQHGMPGVDLNVHFSPEDLNKPEADNMGVTVSSTTYAPSDPSDFIHHTDIGFLLAPTYANDRIECRINRKTTLPETPPLFQGQSISIKLVLIDGDRNVSDETDIVSHLLSRVEPPEKSTVFVEHLPPTPADAFRVMTWNVANGSILEKPDLYSKILTLLNPDIFLFEEVKADSAEKLGAFLSDRISKPGDSWQVIFGKGGGPNRCVIASRLPIEPVDSLESIAYPDRPDRSVRTAGGIVTVNGRRVLIAPLHLKCCGRIDSWEDQKRRQEVTLINHAVKEAKNLLEFDAVVMGGDLNLVGGYPPITLLGADLDFDQSGLSILDPYHLQGRTNTTWASSTERFVPGRLDFLLYSDSSLSPALSFVFDTADFSGQWLTGHSLARDASITASDHFPVIADFSWKN